MYTCHWHEKSNAKNVTIFSDRFYFFGCGILQLRVRRISERKVFFSAHHLDQSFIHALKGNKFFSGYRVT